MSVTLTENNAIQYSDTTDKCLDLFSKIGALRNTTKGIILTKFQQAFQEQPELASRIAFWARAAREGAGEREVFHTILENMPDKFIADNAKTIAELGYWKDLLRYFHIPEVVEVYATAIRSKDRLACKWAPRKGPNAKLLRDSIPSILMTPTCTNKQYRVWLKENSKTVEQQMSSKQWDDIKYQSVPGRAMRTYGKAFDKHDQKRFTCWKEDKTSKASVSASYPHDVIKTVSNLESWQSGAKKDVDWALAQKQWNNLPNYVKEGENILPIADVSGSMCGLPLLVSVSLGMYLANRNKGQFNNTFLTFSARPEFVKLTGNLEKDIPTVVNANWDMNTDFERAYRLILDTAVSFNAPQEHMPTMLLVLSDMQFDQSQEGRNRPHFQLIQEEFKEAGYKLPKLVFWNLQTSVCDGSPAEANDDGVALVSGFSPVLMKAILAVEDFNPIEVMKEALEPIKVNFKNLPETFEHTENVRSWELEEDWSW